MRMDITEELLQLQDISYKSFQCKLMPTVDENRVIGIRTPILRGYAHKLSPEAALEFMGQLPHRFYEEDNLHAFLIERIKDFDDCVSALDRFLPYVDNWATCDCMRPKCLKKNKTKLLENIQRWIADRHEYTVRFAIGLLMCHYLEEDFDPVYLRMVACVDREEYYIKMMVAWYFATALAKQYEKTIIYLEEDRLPAWTCNKAIQKAIESYRITQPQKAYLRSLRRKV